MESSHSSLISPEDSAMIGQHLPLISPEKAAEVLAKKRQAYDALLEEIREGNRTRASEDVVREQGGAVIRIAAQGE